MNPFENAPFKHVSITDAVHVFTQPDGGWCLNNVAIFVGTDVLVVVDTMATQMRNEALLGVITAVRGHRRVVTVNTHFHGDHTFGNSQVRGIGVIMASTATRAGIASAGLHLCAMWPHSNWGAIETCLPDVTFTGSIDIWDGADNLTLMEFSDAHTASDVVLWDAGRSVLCAGDLLMNEVTPFFLMGSTNGYLRALKSLKALRPQWIVPGHGPVGGAEIIDQNLAYVQWCIDYGTDCRNSGRTPLEAAQQADLGPFAAWADPERLVGNLHAVYAELDQRAPDLEAALADCFRFSPDAMRVRV
jgi:cyclase